MASKTTNLFARFDEAEFALCMLINRGAHRTSICAFFSIVSRLGNGVFWYSLMLMLPILYGEAGLHAAAHMFIIGLLGVALYKILKGRLVRERPFIAFPDIRCGTPPLDRYSFPSGHTLHAVSFSVLVMYYFPELGWLVVPFAALVAASRVILGLHYPTDVLAGAALGAGLAASSVLVVAG